MIGAPVAAPEFFFIRHGETDWNREGRLQGQLDIPMNSVGRDQAAGAGRTLKRLLADQGIDSRSIRFVASPLERARDTMERVRLALELSELAYDLDERLKEIAFGTWEGSTWSDLKRRVPLDVKARRRDKWHFRPPGGESYDDLAARLRPWLAAVMSNDVVVAHGGVARALLQVRGLVASGAAPDLDIAQGRVLWFRDGGCEWV